MREEHGQGPHCSIRIQLDRTHPSVPGGRKKHPRTRAQPSVPGCRKNHPKTCEPNGDTMEKRGRSCPRYRVWSCGNFLCVVGGCVLSAREEGREGGDRNYVGGREGDCCYEETVTRLGGYSHTRLPLTRLGGYWGSGIFSVVLLYFLPFQPTQRGCYEETVDMRRLLIWGDC